jgi:hypothetical protein
LHSGSFEMTHIAVANLNKYINYLSDDEIINILEATITNSQIIDDKDVQDFIGFAQHKLDQEKKMTIKK